MKRRALLLLSVVLLSFAASARADVFLLGFQGFDYQSPNPDAVNYLAPGEGYKMVGFITSWGADLDPYTDPSVRQYTVYLFNLTVQTTFFAGGQLEADFFNGGRGRYYSDPIGGTGTAATYGINPPNATSPSTFVDGQLELGGSIDGFVLTYDFNASQGDFNGTMNLDEGPLLAYISPSQYSGWVLAGLRGRGLSGLPATAIPAGYDHQVQGECRRPNVVPTSNSTWGAIKALYR